MHDLQTNNLPFTVALFEVEELEQRLENKWGPCHDEEVIETDSGCETKTVIRCV